MQLSIIKCLSFISLSGFLFSQTAIAQTCNANMKPLTPDNRFTILTNGSEVKDNATGLIWQRCSIGQIWNGTTCIGEAKKYTWKEALKVSKDLGNNYRLPNVRELRSIIEKQCIDLAINQTIFPNTRPDYYWTSTPGYSGTYFNGFSKAYDFNNGNMNSLNTTKTTFIRLVR